jgi:hypothetical protein
MCGCMLMHETMDHEGYQHYPPQPMETPMAGVMPAANRQVCPHCAFPLEQGFAFCPNCGMSLKTSKCSACGQKVDPSWSKCAYCGSPLGQADLVPAHS